MAYKTFVNGYALTASELNAYLMNQSVMVFADSSARSTAITSPTEGMLSYLTGTDTFEYYTGSAWAAMFPLGADTALNRPVLTSPREKITVSATAATGTVHFDVKTQADLYYTTNASANFTINVRGDSSTSLDSLMSTGQTQTIVFRNTNGSTAYYASTFTIDGVTVTPKWQGGSAPTGGNASSVDVYTYAITKTGSAAYTVFAAQTKFA